MAAAAPATELIATPAQSAAVLRERLNIFPPRRNRSRHLFGFGFVDACQCPPYSLDHWPDRKQVHIVAAGDGWKPQCNQTLNAVHAARTNLVTFLGKHRTRSIDPWAT